MAIGPIELNGMVSRTQDYSTIRQNEDNKAIVDQSNYHNQMDKNVREKSTQVIHADDSDYYEHRPDAKDKGSNEYAGDGGRRPSEQNKKEDRVVIKGQSTFDIKI